MVKVTGAPRRALLGLVPSSPAVTVKDDGAVGGRLTTLTATLSTSLSGPPAPVLPWSLVVMRRLAAPLKPAAGVKVTVARALLRAARVPVIVTVPVPLPLSVTSPP